MRHVWSGPDATPRGFRIFSASHLAAAGFFLAAAVLLGVFGARLSGTAGEAIVRVLLATTLLANELGLSLWRLRWGRWTWRDSLPLHLCGVSVVLAAVMLYTKSYAIFELTYFWAMGGALQGLITPDTEGYDFPHFRFAQTFLSHGFIVLANLFMVFVLGMRPTLLSLAKSLVVLNLWAIAMLCLDLASGANYGFLRHKPEGPTLFDLLGPWPWYLASLEVLAVVISLLCYLPFVVFR